ncbi:hypothetical protein, partial [Actinomadura sp. 7K507]|uniref:hypothetical protein n=1 Tax=Actinomadura sp. 7K507 TaxID=2530365 RepID=UPI001A9E5E24
MVSALSLTLVACGSGSTTARCVDRSSPSTGKSGYRVVPDSRCDTDDIDGSSAPYGRYFWYYGGRTSSGFVSGGSRVRPEGKIKSTGGRALSRGGLGGGGRGGG